IVAKRTFPRVMTSGSGAGFSEVSPLQPNHTPPVCWSAARTPTARPPGAAPRLGSEMRLDTQTNRLMWFDNARARDEFQRCPALSLDRDYLLNRDQPEQAPAPNRHCPRGAQGRARNCTWGECA